MSQTTLARRSKFASSDCALRFNDLTLNLAKSLGGLANLNEVERTMVRSAAALVLRLEQLQAALTAGENVNPTCWCV
jgi:hypothetical protein